MVKTKKEAHKRQPSINHFFVLTDNEIKAIGATSLSEALISNTTLTELNLSCEDKKRHIKDVHQQFTLFFSLLFNR